MQKRDGTGTFRKAVVEFSFVGFEVPHFTAHAVSKQASSNIKMVQLVIGGLVFKVEADGIKSRPLQSNWRS
jgi:hypothetical protein